MSPPPLQIVPMRDKYKLLTRGDASELNADIEAHALDGWRVQSYSVAVGGPHGATVHGVMMTKRVAKVKPR